MVRRLVVLLALLSGCTTSMLTVDEARKAGEGTSAEYAATPTRVWTAIDAVLNWGSAEQTQDSRDKGYLFIWFERSNGCQPTYVGVWVEEKQAGRATVTVVSRKTSSCRASALTEEDFHKDLTKALGFLDQGKKLPLVRPE